MKPEPTAKPAAEGPKISAAQATLLRHHIGVAKLTTEKAAILKAKADKVEIEDLTVPEFKEVLSEVRKTAS